MRNFYLYLTGIALLASGAEMISEISGDATASQEWLVKPETKSDKKQPERVPFARARKKIRHKGVPCAKHQRHQYLRNHQQCRSCRCIRR
jgi:hypothetical protein